MKRDRLGPIVLSIIVGGIVALRALAATPPLPCHCPVGCYWLTLGFCPCWCHQPKPPPQDCGHEHEGDSHE